MSVLPCVFCPECAALCWVVGRVCCWLCVHVVVLCVSDDTEFITGEWTSLAVSALSGLSPPNVGVVGPVCDQGNNAILTHDFVHVNHWRIFGYYYPPVFDNWWIDDWITRVYKVCMCLLCFVLRGGRVLFVACPMVCPVIRLHGSMSSQSPRTLIVRSWHVVHHTSAHGTRYSVNQKQKDSLLPSIQEVCFVDILAVCVSFSLFLL
jgi:hypothetical protein